MPETSRPLVVSTGASRAARWLVALFVLLTGASVFLLAHAPFHYRLMYAILMTGFFLALVMREPSHSGARLIIDVLGEAEMEYRNGLRSRAVLGRRQWLTSYFSLVRVRVGGRNVNLLVLPGAQEAGEYRRMLVMLRHMPEGSIK